MKVFSTSLALIFLTVIGGLTLFGKLPIPVIAVYLLMSLITFFMYWKDKSAARKDQPRTPENTLHLLAVFCGWPGALIGQQTLRHKTQKVSFRVVLWLTVLVNVGVLVGLIVLVWPF